MRHTAGPDSQLTIDLDAYKRNLAIIRSHVGAHTRVMAVVKGNAYGHGMLECATAALRAGIHWLGVAHAWEGIMLREAGFTTPVLVLGSEYHDNIPAMIEHDLSFSVSSFDMLPIIESACNTIHKPCHVHIKVDTGMGRFGINSDDTAELVKRAAAIRGVTIEGIFTHFSCADQTDDQFSRMQIETFASLIDNLAAEGLRPPIAHMCNSPATIKFPDAHFDLVRTGLMTYGLQPYADSNSTLAMEPVLHWTSRVAYIKDVPAGFRVSYGGSFVTTRPSRLAVVPVGYADGFRRRLSNRGRGLINGQSVPIAGTVCMDHTVFDITDAGDVALGDTITLIGTDGTGSITAEEHAEIVGTINYEITTAIASRVPRTYTETT